MLNAKITGIASYLPDYVLTNDELSRKTVNDIAAEGTYYEGGDYEAAHHVTYHIFVSVELFRQVDGQDGHQAVEREKKQEIG